jgi:hypothetical protein
MTGSTGKLKAGEIVGEFVFVAGLTALLLATMKHREAPEEEPEDDLIDAARLLKEIDALHSAAHELDRLDNLIISARLCKRGEIHKAFQVGWQDIEGKTSSVDFMIDGESAESAYIIDMAYARREELNTELCERIIDLYQRAVEMQREE